MNDRHAINALAPWFGAKRNLAQAIVAELGEHRCYWEPFCGSMAVLLAKPPCAMETANDLHGDLVNLARVLADDVLGPKLYRRLRRTLMCEAAHREAAERRKARGYRADGAGCMDAAADFFLCSWLGRNGVAGTATYNQGFCLRFTANGGHAAKRLASVVDSIPAWRRRLRNVTILCRDAFDLLPRIEDATHTAIYVDPPYVRKGAKYVHDFAAGDHARLAGELRRFKRARVVVSYYDEPEVRELYRGWTFREIEVTKALVNQGMRDKGGAKKVCELLIVNGESHEAGADLFANAREAV